MPIFDHSKFLSVFLYQKGFNKFRMCIFGHSEFIPVFLGKNCQKKFGMSIFGHSELMPVSLGDPEGCHWCMPPNRIQFFHFCICFCQKAPMLEVSTPPWLGAPQCEILGPPLSIFGKNCWKKIKMAIFGHSEFIQVFLKKIVGKNSEWPFLAILILYQSFWEKLSKKIQNSHF